MITVMPPSAAPDAPPVDQPSGRADFRLPRDSGPRRAGKPQVQRQSVARAVAQFALTGVVAVAVIGFVSVRILQRTGEREAIRDAKQETALAGRGIVAPEIRSGLLAGQAAEVQRINVITQRYVLRDPVVRVKLWDAGGRIIYANDRRLIGSRYPLGAQELAALRTAGTDAEVSDLAKPENRFERSYHKLLEVYIGVVGPGGVRLLYEEYLRYGSVAASGKRLWSSFGPLLIVTLVLLELGQVPLAFSLARRLRRRQEEREMLLRGAIEASEKERRRIARDLHDGVVQNLAGVSYTLAAAARTTALPEQTSAVIERAATELRESIRALRSLLVDIYPPTLQRAGLQGALTDLISALVARSIETDVALDTSGVPERYEPVLHRVAQEALRNVAGHAGATKVTVRLRVAGGSVRLSVADNGRGFVPGLSSGADQNEHFGLNILDDLAHEAGGRLTLQSAPGQGTTVSIELPV